MIINSGTFIQLLFFTNSQYIFTYVCFLLQYIYAYLSLQAIQRVDLI